MEDRCQGSSWRFVMETQEIWINKKCRCCKDICKMKVGLFSLEFSLRPVNEGITC